VLTGAIGGAEFKVQSAFAEATADRGSRFKVQGSKFKVQGPAWNRKRQKDGGKNMKTGDFFAPIFLPVALSVLGEWQVFFHISCAPIICFWSDLLGFSRMWSHRSAFPSILPGPARRGKNCRFGPPSGPIKPCWKPVFTFIGFDWV
jgi:hypothetical protein